MRNPVLDKIENKYFIRQAVYNGISLFILIIVVYYIGKEFFPKLTEAIFTSYFWTIYSFIVLYLGYRKYRELKEFSSRYEYIYNIRRENQSYAKMEQLAVWSEILTDINKTKLDLLKYFSPIPLLIFVLGVYINNNSLINNKIDILSTKLLLGDILMYLGIGVPVFYCYFLYSAFRSYSKSAREMMDFKGEAVLLKENTK